MRAHQPGIAKLIEGSSLGTHTARAARSTVPAERGRSLVRRAADKTKSNATKMAAQQRKSI